MTIMGDVASIRSLLSHRKAIERIEEHGGQEGVALLAEARGWLKDALAHENVHGPDSRLDLSDPWVRDVLVPAKERLRDRRRQRLRTAATDGFGIICSAERAS